MRAEVSLYLNARRAVLSAPGPCQCTAPPAPLPVISLWHAFMGCAERYLALRPTVTNTRTGIAVQYRMASGILMRTSNTYRDQLDRTRRWLAKIEKNTERAEEDYQDETWAFFQSCWHLKDWVKNDCSLPKDIREIVTDAAHASTLIQACQKLANGTKHLILTKQVMSNPKLKGKRSGSGVVAAHSHIGTNITPGSATVISVVIDMGGGKTRDGLELARELVTEWERILTVAGLSIARRS
jgi:hypothetical protein